MNNEKEVSTAQGIIALILGIGAMLIWFLVFPAIIVLVGAGVLRLFGII